MESPIGIPNLPVVPSFSTFSALAELLSNLVFEDCWSCGDLVKVGGFNSIFESNAGDDLGEIIKAA